MRENKHKIAACLNKDIIPNCRYNLGVDLNNQWDLTVPYCKTNKPFQIFSSAVLKIQDSSSHISHFCEKNDFHNFVHLSILIRFSPCYRTSVDCRECNGVECRLWRVKTMKIVECWEGNVMQGVKWCVVSSVECTVWSVECGVPNLKCKVWSVEQGVQSVKFRV